MVYCVIMVEDQGTLPGYQSHVKNWYKCTFENKKIYTFEMMY